MEGIEEVLDISTRELNSKNYKILVREYQEVYRGIQKETPEFLLYTYFPDSTLTDVENVDSVAVITTS